MHWTLMGKVDWANVKGECNGSIKGMVNGVFDKVLISPRTASAYKTLSDAQ